MYKRARLKTASRNCTFYKTLLFLFTIPVCRAVLVNRTIDSNFGDPVTGFVPIYQPQSSWSNQTTSCDSIPSCTIQPDKAKAFDGTWYTTNTIVLPPNLNVNITLRFAGVAVWVFFILPGYNDTFNVYTTTTNVNITLDGQYTGTYSYVPDMTTQDMTYNATVFSTSGLANTSHELVIWAKKNPYSINYINFDWAIYTVDLEAPASQNPSSSTSVAFPSTTASTIPTPQSSSSKIGVILGCTLGGLAVVTLVLLFLIRRLRRAPPVRNKEAEGILDIDVPPPNQPYYKREIPVPVHEPTQSKLARLREARQKELDEHIQSAQHELDNLRSLRIAGSTGDIGHPSTADLSRPSPELRLLRDEMQQLRDWMDYLQAQRESDWAMGSSNEPLPPAYAQLSNDVQ